MRPAHTQRGCCGMVDITKAIVYVSETDIRLMSQEEGDNYAGDIRDEDDDPSKIHAVYLHYLDQRRSTYMTLETGRSAAQESMEVIEKQDAKEVLDKSAEG